MYVPWHLIPAFSADASHAGCYGLAGWHKRGCVIESTVELPEKTMDLFAPTHLLVLLLIVLIIFGPSKLGDVGGALGEAVKDFKKAINDEPDPKPVVKAEDT